MAKKKSYTTVKKLTPFAKVGISKEVEYFMENLAMLFSTGMDITYALDSIKEGIRTPQMKRAVDDIQREIREGSPLWRILDKIGLLKPSSLALIKIGEETGQLPESLKMVVEQMQKEAIFNSRIRSGMMYPSIVLGIGLFMGIGISWFLLPSLADVFMSMNMELPPTTVVMLTFGIFIKENGAWAIPTFLLVISITFFFLFINPKTKNIGQYLLYHTPVIKTLIKEVETARFGHVFGTLLGSGTPIMQALDSLIDSTNFYNFKKFYKYFKVQIGLGAEFGQIFKSYKGMKTLFPANVQYLLIASKKAGQLQPTLKKVSRIYEEKVENTTKNLSVLLEPLMLVFIWAGVLGIAMGVLQPIYGLIGNFDMGTQSAPPPTYVELIGKDLPKQARGIVNTEEKLEARSVSVRFTPETGSVQFDAVHGQYYDIYDYDEESGWYLIETLGPTGNETRGWIDEEYITIIETYEIAIPAETTSD